MFAARRHSYARADVSVPCNAAEHRLQIEMGMYEELQGPLEAVATADFYRQLIDFAKSKVPVDVEWVVRYSPFAPPALLHCAKRVEIRTLVDLDMVNKLYDGGFYKMDPWFRYWTSYRAPGVVTAENLPSHQAKDDFYSALKPFLGDMDVIAMFLPAYGGNSITMFLEREERFNHEESVRLQEIYPIIRSLHEVHIKSLMTQAWLGAPAAKDSLLQLPAAVQILDMHHRTLYESEQWRAAKRQFPSFARAAETVRATGERRSTKMDFGTFHVDCMDFPDLWGRNLKVITFEHSQSVATPLDIEKAISEFEPVVWTPREREMVRLILWGNSNEKISEVLDIGVGTIRNHRKRIYDKLYISAERELFAMFLNSLIGEARVA
ncbi:hypothetical protein ASD36_16830 [Rhizobium sp. Root1334]|nr:MULTISPECIES: helix-turn-helix transcriptional regulator [unclassified Rhizobium]KQV40439.1 hypothetical protein ASC96_20860 [Rhizobium sp. Root1204]KQY02802.1 hypothetical protein ASD36_16830 [Rhizobium sp. Root1334]